MRKETGITVSIGNWQIRAYVTWYQYAGDPWTPPSWEIDKVSVVLVVHYAIDWKKPSLILCPQEVALMGPGWVAWLVHKVWDHVEENPWILSEG